MIRGNVYSSTAIAAETPRNYVEAAPIQKVETFRNVSSGSMVNRAFVIPLLWNDVYTRGHIRSFSTSDLHIQKNTTQVHYGIFKDLEDSRFWFSHKAKDFMFYGARYSVDNWETKAHVDSMFGVYNYAFRLESSTDERLRDGMRELISRTGLKGLEVRVPQVGELGYTGIEFNLKFSEENTYRMMEAAKKHTLKDGGEHITNDLDKMKLALRKMAATLNSDPRAFSAAYAEFGEAISEKPSAFQAALKLAGEGVKIEYLIEGTKISMYYRSWKTDSEGNWIPVANPQGHELPFDPRLRHSKAHGVVIGRNQNDVSDPHFVNLRQDP